MPILVRSRQVRETDDATDEELVARALVDRHAFAALYDRYLDAVYRYCSGRLADRAAAEDATSLVFMRAMTALPAFRGGSFRSWLFAIAHNTLVDARRAARVDRPLAEAIEIPDAGPSPEDLATAAERQRSVRDALTRLPEEQRRVVELRLAGLTGPAVAATLGLSHDAVRTTQKRALARLRVILGIVPTGEEGHDAS